MTYTTPISLFKSDKHKILMPNFDFLPCSNTDILTPVYINC